jgi:hypothetical protein
VISPLKDKEDMLIAGSLGLGNCKHKDKDALLRDLPSGQPGTRGSLSIAMWLGGSLGVTCHFLHPQYGAAIKVPVHIAGSYY